MLARNLGQTRIEWEHVEAIRPHRKNPVETADVGFRECDPILRRAPVRPVSIGDDGIASIVVPVARSSEQDAGDSACAPTAGNEADANDAASASAREFVRIGRSLFPLRSQGMVA
jgi:hypothetical protein